MPEKVMPGPVEGTGGIREAVCVHTRKIYDSCRDKDCIEDLRFYPKLQYVDVINHALSVKGGSVKSLPVWCSVCSTYRLHSELLAEIVQHLFL